MATKIKSTPSAPASNEDWEIDDAVRTLTRAQEIENDPKLMAKVKKRAAEKAKELTEVANGQVASMVKRGMISDKQADKLRANSKAKD